MSYLKLLRQSQARRNEPRSREVGRDLSTFRRQDDECSVMLPVPCADAQRLTTAGYRPKVSFFERVIWERPDTGFYVSEEMALHLLDAKNIQDKSGANARR
jgi:hypothetical protein